MRRSAAGWRCPAFNEIDPPAPYDTLTSLNPFLDPMRSTTFEVGARGTIGSSDQAAAGQWPGTFAYDTAVYWIGVEDEIVPQDGGAFFLSAGESRRLGFEMGGEWRPRSPLNIGLALTLSDNEYVEYTNELGDLSGNEVPGLPSAVVTGAVGVTIPRGFSAQVDVEAADSYFADDANTAATHSYFLVNLTGGYSRAIGSSTLRGVALALERRRPGIRRLGVHQRHERRVLRARTAAQLGARPHLALLASDAERRYRTRTSRSRAATPSASTRSQ